MIITSLEIKLFRLLDIQLGTTYREGNITHIPSTERFKVQLRPICVLWHIAIFMINYVKRLWSQGGDVTHSIIAGCERRIRKCATMMYTMN